MLNFAVDELHTIRSLAHDMFIDVIQQWKKLGIVVMKDTKCHQGSSIPGSQLCDSMIDSLLELAFTSQDQLNTLEKFDSVNTTNIQSNAGESITRCTVPVGELLMIIYLHAFPINPPNMNLADNSNNVFEDIPQETSNVSTKTEGSV